MFIKAKFDQKKCGTKLNWYRIFYFMDYDFSPLQIA